MVCYLEEFDGNHIRLFCRVVLEIGFVIPAHRIVFILPEIVVLEDCGRHHPIEEPIRDERLRFALKDSCDAERPSRFRARIMVTRWLEGLSTVDSELRRERV